MNGGMERFVGEWDEWVVERGGNERNLCGFERWNWNEDVLVREILKC